MTLLKNGEPIGSERVRCCEGSHEKEAMHVLWFKFIHGLMSFALISILFATVPDYGNDYMTKESKN